MEENPYEAPKIPTEREGVRLTMVEVFVYLILAAIVIAMIVPAVSL